MKNNYEESIVDLCLQMRDYSSKSDVKKHNEATIKLLEIYDELSQDKDLAQLVYSHLMNSEIEKVRALAASHCLKMGIKIKEAEKVLITIASTSKNPIERFSAEMTLQVWKEQGYL